MNPQSVASPALEHAARVCRAVQRHLVPAQSADKPDRSPVTVADYASQAIICRHLREATDLPIVAEESTDFLRSDEGRLILNHVVEHVRSVFDDADERSVLEWLDFGGGGTAERFWTLDPIDGTKGFLRRGQYAVALGLIESGEVTFGALACPELPVDMQTAGAARGVLCYAATGAGAWQQALDGGGDASRLQVSNPGDAPTRMVESVESGHANQDAHARIAAQIGIDAEPVRMDSQAKYVAVARGDAAVYLRLQAPSSPDYRERIWDHAGGYRLVLEAGGAVTDSFGAQLDFAAGDRLFANRGVVATGGIDHDQVIRACRDAQAVSS